MPIDRVILIDLLYLITCMKNYPKQKIWIPCGWIPSLLAVAGMVTAKMTTTIAHTKSARSVFPLILPQLLISSLLPKRIEKACEQVKNWATSSLSFYRGPNIPVHWITSKRFTVERVWSWRGMSSFFCFYSFKCSNAWMCMWHMRQRVR